MIRSVFLGVVLLCLGNEAGFASPTIPLSGGGDCPVGTPELRLFPQHDGVWEGTFRLFDLNGKLEEEWKSHIEMKLVCDTWFQSNTYAYQDGSKVTYKFPAKFSPDGKLVFKTDRIEAIAYEAGEHVLMDTVYVVPQPWADKTYQIITLLDSKTRFRVLKRLKDGKAVGVTVIQETKVSDEVDPSLFK